LLAVLCRRWGFLTAAEIGEGFLYVSKLVAAWRTSGSRPVFQA
jgi:hypothetical protein